MNYAFDGGGRLTDLDWNLNGTTNDFNYDFTYTPSSQTASVVLSNTALEWNPGALFSDSYTANGLNQYTDVDGSTPVYDANGNITTDHRGRIYSYDAENRLKTVSDSGTILATYYYSADGLVRARNTASGLTEHMYSGDQEIYEFTGGYSSRTVQRRYVRLPGSVDEPILMIDYTLNGACTTTSYAACEVWSHQDRQGSVVATSDSLGNKLDTYTYSPYGESGPEGDAGFPFRFTGQKLDAATGLYYYKARFYDPEVGRFLQTDPIGYGDGMNMYAYVGGDPVNGTDPSGLAGSDPNENDSGRSCDNPTCTNEDNIIVTGGESGDGYRGAVSGRPSVNPPDSITCFTSACQQQFFAWIGVGGRGRPGDGDGSGGSLSGGTSGSSGGQGSSGGASPSGDACDGGAPDCIVVTGKKLQPNFLDGLVSIGFDFSNCPCLPTEDYTIDETGLTIVAKRKKQRQFNGRTISSLNKGLYLIERQKKAQGELACQVAGISAGTSGLYALANKRSAAKVRNFAGGLTLFALGTTYLICYTQGIDVVIHSN